MARDRLGVLLTIRQRTVDQSRQDLVACTRAETAAEAAIRAIDHAVQQERSLADRSADTHTMEMFVHWVRRFQAERVAAVAALGVAEGRTMAARAALAAARSAFRAVERVIEERADLARLEAEKREQHTLDDVSRGQRRTGQGGE